jgi:hypothetical protein
MWSSSRLNPRTTSAASVQPTPGGGFVLRFPDGDAANFRLAQLDDYMDSPRSRFRWNSPLRITLRARVSARDHAGTWGFGLWNDPFSVSFGVRGTARRLPALPNAAWFFFASGQNHLSLRDDRPGSGFLAATFSSPHLPSLFLAPGLMGLPLLAFGLPSRWLRRRAAGVVLGDGKRLQVDPAQWLNYTLRWSPARVGFAVEGQTIFETGVIPRGPLGLVIWMDNQFAAWRPDGTVALGLLAGPAATMEIEELRASADS